MMSIDGKTNDSLNARLDLREMGIRERYHPKVREDGKLDFLPGDYTLSDDDNRVLCKWLFELQVLDGYSGNLSRCVAAGERSISRYLHRVETKFNQRDRNDDRGQSLSDTSQLPIFSTPGKSFGKGVLEEMSIELLEAAKFYVLQNCDECLPFIQEHKNILMHSGVRNMKESDRLQFSNWFHERGNLIGSRNFGSVYKGVLPSDGTLVAIKVLNLLQQRASKSFMDKCKALRSIRHIDLLRIITACSSIDNQGQDFKSLVFEYMVNGSLDAWLHLRDDEQSRSKRLSLIQKCNIAIEVASALDYIHHRCGTSIVHCDMKPGNVLLNEDMVAHVGDLRW
ncbi:probable L-type lectin-domain containing receptor kinase V.3 [Pyrus x bretschneideri]|uniref:probable L-type lectin-domain containing receptor kinase V.3 n=1 Tax=Pyrus x bretschneideri TaxID=225117 RepID=UPI00202F6EDD|nr:probable L-type lectin-domain containing receptor kinase V.3 [Pyrus x bretschneideri]